MQEYYEIKTKQGVMRGFFHKPDGNQYPVCIIFHGFTGQNTGTKFSYVQLSRIFGKAKYWNCSYGFFRQWTI